MNLKIEAARRQLGMSLHLHLLGQDPVSVHCLASGGSELIERFVDLERAVPIIAFLVQQDPGLTITEARRLQRQHWNAFKHATGKKEGSPLRDDDELLAGFCDEHNDAPLFIGWTDYGNAVGKMPIEAQAYVAWYLAKNPAKVATDEGRWELDRLFPGLAGKSPARQKAALVRAIERVGKNKTVMRDPRTEHRPLVLGWPPA